MIVTGDITQVDLPNNYSSGLVGIQNILKNVKGIQFVHLHAKDVVRNDLVQRIILAYEKVEKKRKTKGNRYEKKI